jgi:CubicO group peptidase (beta-lactamase class C family)
MNKTIAIVCILCLFLVSCVNTKQGNDGLWSLKSGSTIAKEIHQRMELALGEQKFMGASVGMIHQNKIQLMKGYGKTRKDGESITKDTLFQIGTATRLFTSALAGLMVEYRQFEWNSSIQEYMPEFALENPWVTQSYTIDDILLERSGWSPQAGQFLPLLGFDENYILAQSSKFQVHSSFRDSYSPQNITRLLLTKVITEATGKQWNELLQSEILDKMNMELLTGTSEYYQKEFCSFPHYISSEGDLQGYPIGSHAMMKVPETMKSAMGASLNCEDALTWIQMFFSSDHQNPSKEAVLDEKVLQELLQPIYRRGRGMFSEHSFCTRSGWIYEKIHNEEVFWCIGTGYGFASFFMMIPSQETGLVLLTNTSNQSIYYDIASIFLQGQFLIEGLNVTPNEPMVQSEEVPLRLMIDPLEPEAYQGVYVHNVYGEIEVVTNLDNIGVLLGETKEFHELKHYNADVFYFEDPKILPMKVFVSFQKEGDDKIVSCTVDYMKDTPDPFFMKE